MERDDIKRFSIAIKGLILYNGRFFIVKRSQHCMDTPSTWEVPCGTMEIGETMEECLLREIKEEVGLPADTF